MLNKKYKFILVITVVIVLVSVFFSTLLFSSKNIKFDSLIEHVSKNINYQYSRKYSTYLIDQYLLNNTNLLDEINLHSNELQYIQIEEKEKNGIHFYKSSDLERNVVLNDEYYYRLLKPYSYLYLEFSLVTEFQGFFTMHYYIEASQTGIKNYMNEREKVEILNSNIDEELSRITSTVDFVEDFTSKDGESIYLLEKDVSLYPDSVYDRAFMMGSLYEIRALKPYGIFYRKISLDYIYEFIKQYVSNYEEEFEISKKEFAELLKDNLKNIDYFDPTNFILEEYRIRG